MSKVQKTELLFEFLRVVAALLIAYLAILVLITVMFDNPLEGMYLFIVGPFSSMRRIGNLVARIIPYAYWRRDVFLLHIRAV